MTTIYDVDVQRYGRHLRTVRVAAQSPIHACEAAERIAAKDHYGPCKYNDYLDTLHLFFANKVREVTAADLMAASS